MTKFKLTLAAAAFGLAGTGTFAWITTPIDTVGKVAFEQQLAIPPLADSFVDDQGRRVFHLTAQEGTSDLGGVEPIRTWGFNGDYLGPTLRAMRGEEVVVDIANQLPEETTVHWHGMHLPAAMDGGPHQMIDPGGTWTPTWTVDQPAATLWYHPHPHGATAQHVGRGLVGMFVLDDPAEAALDLPREYGIDDLPLIIQDVTLVGDYVQGADQGDHVLVNGTPGPYAGVSTELVRLRLLNASSMRVFRFEMDDSSEFDQIASDGGLLPEPNRTSQLTLSPGERAEIVVSMEPGETRVLRSNQPDLGTGVLDRFSGGADRFDILELRATAELTPSSPLPETLVPDIADHAGLEQDASWVRTFELTDRTINGKKMDMQRIDEVIPVGQTEVWDVINTSPQPHNFHVHDVQFRVLRAGGETPGPELSGLKDTVYLPPDVPIRLLMTFTDHTDPEVPYMYHCHLLRHEDEGMMGQFVVVEQGTEVPESLSSALDHNH